MTGAPSPSNASDEIRDGLFFIVGNHRGGTTLLQSMLNAHARLTIPPETQYFLEVWPRRERLGDLSAAAARDRVAAFLHSEDCSLRDLDIASAEILSGLSELSLKCGREPDYADLLVVILERWSRRRGKPRAGDKSPGHIHTVGLMAELFPRAKFIASLRDPRAVVSSELAAEWGARSVDQIARRWRRVVERHHELEKTLSSERYMMLRYEDLVTAPEASLRRVCGFLGETFEDAMLRFYERPAAEIGFDPSESWKLATLKPLDPGRLDAWREALSSQQIDLVECAAGRELSALGYEPASIERPGAWGRAWHRFRDRIPWAIEVASGAARRKRGARRQRPSRAAPEAEAAAKGPVDDPGARL